MYTIPIYVLLLCLKVDNFTLSNIYFVAMAIYMYEVRYKIAYLP
jgi:hypothetical protein